ncbi:potassium channel family protein [Microlunatus elymi]|uniref:Potassium channel family protein n=1 Tax=Microlunatus elymi TaxID=2596828 RepID=A0A516Q287_9ACTN|nr:potassium channel family protein [Microlunatus elymi]QDP97518.1 potassium channel family protein [Microlunatus elymi]
MTDDDELRLHRWESHADLPLTVVALVFLVAYAVPILDDHLSPKWDRAYDVATWASWLAFAIDYVVRLCLARHRAAFVRSNLLDLAVVVLPMLRPLRLLRVLALVDILNRRAGSSLRGRVGVYVAGSMVLVLFVGSLAVLDAERHAPGSNIHTSGQALWWSIVTVSTVGYGDFYPVSTTGRLVGVGMMISGIALLGVVTASVASWLVDRVRQVEQGAQAATRADVAKLAAKIDSLERLLAQRDAPKA